MNTVVFEHDNAFETGTEAVLHLPSGLLGFEQVKRFKLIPAQEQPFYWLKAECDPSLCFLVVSPFDIVEHYSPDIPTEEVRALGIECPDDVCLLNIITLRSSQRATINLKGPIVVNRFSRIAKQVVISNSAEYSLQHPVVGEESEALC